ncbi:MAG: thioesterase family protein [Salinivirgaceae bacterium]|nr:thioesterase family protein [Salinivirgaceae bacterium]MDD4747528.1 thioesterase family protein [Salinivirgaceae bacterium]MDY0279983.1 thioesterase family protein [Salinivirgaceae bacterium]
MINSLTVDVQHRIRYADTDQMGVVYYGNYAVLYEIGRTELIRSLGISYAEIEESGILMPVIELNSRYIRPLKYDELITIRTTVKKRPSASIVFDHEILNSTQEICNRGWVKLGFVNKITGKPTRIPALILDKITATTEL